jgi:hypothetical protein
MSLASRLWPVKRVIRKLYPVKVPQPRWDLALAAGEMDRLHATLAALPESAPNVLIVPTMSHPSITTFDSMLGVALTLRGIRVQYLMCGETLPACQAVTLQFMPNEQEFLDHGAKRVLCGSCYKPGAATLKSLGFPVRQLNELVTADELRYAKEQAAVVPIADIVAYREDGVLLGEHAFSGAIRYFASGTIDHEPHRDVVLRRYLEAAIITYLAGRRLFSETKFLATSLHHGIYVPQGVISAAGRAKGVRVVNWSLGYRKNTIIFSHGDTYHKTMLDEPTSNWENMPWSEAAEDEIVGYLKDRWTGAQDWLSYNPNGETSRDLIAKEIGVDLQKPCIGLLTNVMWDAQLFYTCNVFPNMMDWLKLTIKHFESRPNVQLLIRVHPAELQSAVRTRQPLMGELAAAFPKLPPNVFIIPPESRLSTYAAMMACDSVLIYGTKTGVELTSFGVPVVVAGEAWIRNKGIAMDTLSQEHYLEILKSLPLGARLPADKVRRARMYAYHYFFRRMIPLEVVKPEPQGAWSSYGLNLSNLDQLGPGGDKGMEVICAGILEGGAFTYQAEIEAAVAAPPAVDQSALLRATR